MSKRTIEVEYKSPSERVVNRANKAAILFVLTTLLTLVGTLITKWATGDFPTWQAFAMTGGALIIQALLLIADKVLTIE